MKVIRCSVDTIGEKISTEQLARMFERAMRAAGFAGFKFEREIAVLQRGPAGVTLSMYCQKREDLTLYCLVHGDASDPVFFEGKSYNDVYIATIKNPESEEAQSVYEHHLRIHQITNLKFCEKLAGKMNVLLLTILAGK